MDFKYDLKRFYENKSHNLLIQRRQYANLNLMLRN